MLQWSVDAFLACERISDVIVVGPPEWVDAPPRVPARAPGIRLVAGGDRRQDSVANGFDAVSEASDIVLVHDAARPFVDPETDRARDRRRRRVGRGRRGRPGPRHGEVVAGGRLAPRGETAVALTGSWSGRWRASRCSWPRRRRRSAARCWPKRSRSAAQAAEGTDEAALAEQAGHRVRIVAGSARNMKVTTAEDLAMAEALVHGIDRRSGGDRGLPVIRVGTGYDLHRLVDGRPLILGGVAIPFDRGLAGHSDADALCHAVTDAILGAASAGDIGQHFPDTDERWRGASSIDLLRAGRGHRAGARVSWS